MVSNEAELSGEKIKKALGEQTNVFIYGITDSTNTRAKRFADGEADELTEGFCFDGECIFAAEAQTGGRGRMGRSFLSDRGGLYFTYLFKPRACARDALSITANAAVAVCRAIDSLCGVRSGIKWVNDIIVNGKKVAGILTEGAFVNNSDHFRYAAIGIGINLKRMDFDGELSAIATDIESEGGSVPDKSLLLVRIIDELRALLSVSSLVNEEYANRSVVIKKTVRVIKLNEEYPARVVGISPRGELIVESERYGTHLLSTGEISIKDWQ